jgi:hypothetical protein
VIGSTMYNFLLPQGGPFSSTTVANREGKRN